MPKAGRPCEFWTSQVARKGFSKVWCATHHTDGHICMARLRSENAALHTQAVACKDGLQLMTRICEERILSVLMGVKLARYALDAVLEEGGNVHETMQWRHSARAFLLKALRPTREEGREFGLVQFARLALERPFGQKEYDRINKLMKEREGAQPCGIVKPSVKSRRARGRRRRTR